LYALYSIILLLIHSHPRSTLFPYTTLFRSQKLWMGINPSSFNRRKIDYMPKKHCWHHSWVNGVDKIVRSTLCFLNMSMSSFLGWASFFMFISNHVTCFRYYGRPFSM